MFGSSFKAPQILELILYSLCVMAVMMTIAADASASEREYAVGYSRLSTADPMGGQMQYSLWYPTEVPEGIVRLGPFEFSGTWDAEPAIEPFAQRSAPRRQPTYTFDLAHFFLPGHGKPFCSVTEATSGIGVNNGAALSGPFGNDYRKGSKAEIHDRRFLLPDNPRKRTPILHYH